MIPIIPDQIKHMLAYVISVEAMLVSIFLWFDKVIVGFDLVVRSGVSLAGLVIAYYTILHLREKIRSTKLDNKIKQQELDKND